MHIVMVATTKQTDRVIVMLDLVNVCKFCFKLQYILVFFHQLYLIVCKHGHDKRVIYGSSSLKSFPCFLKQSLCFKIKKKSSYILNKTFMLCIWSFLPLWLWPGGQRTQERELDIQEPSEETLIRTVQIRQWSWVVPFHKITQRQNMFTKTMELPLNFAFSCCLDTWFIVVEFIWSNITQCIGGDHVNF